MMPGRTVTSTLAQVLVGIAVFSGSLFASVVSPVAKDPLDTEASAHPVEQLLSSYRFRKGHEESLALISSISLPPSCLYSSLTETIISKCSSAPATLDGEEKAFFATKLAVCELSSAKVDYPRECRSDLTTAGDVQRCIRKLESRPQWWTSWSNCIQSVGVLCQAVREEAERDNVLKLHRNITVLQYQLEKRIATSVNLVTSNLQHIETMSSAYRSKLEALENMMSKTIPSIDKRLEHLRLMIDTFNEAEAEQAAQFAQANALFVEKAEYHRKSMESGIRVLEDIQKALELIEAKAGNRIKLEEESGLEQRDMQAAINLSTQEAFDAIKESMKNINKYSSDSNSALNNLLDSIFQGKEQMDEITGKFDRLSAAHDRISNSLRTQQGSQMRHLASIENFAARLNDTISDAFAESEQYIKYLVGSQTQFRGSQRISPVGLVDLLLVVYLPLVISLLVLLNKKRAAIGIVVIAALYACFLTCEWSSKGGEAPETAAGEEGPDGLMIEGAGNGPREQLYLILQNTAKYIRGLW